METILSKKKTTKHMMNNIIRAQLRKKPKRRLMDGKWRLTHNAPFDECYTTRECSTLMTALPKDFENMTAVEQQFRITDSINLKNALRFFNR